ncbi:MAG: hypothetical protein MK213_03275, partial [Planctomycetes bacterium]|nr:hypothetical protein [Planctomycetota bacterium]
MDQRELHTDLTSYLLGELDDAGRLRIEKALAEDPRLREKRAELERMLGLLAECREEPTLGDAEREELRAAAQTPPQVSSWSPFSRNARWAAAAVVVAGVLAVLDPQGGAPLMESETAASGALPDLKMP